MPHCILGINIILPLVSTRDCGRFVCFVFVIIGFTKTDGLCQAFQASPVIDSIFPAGVKAGEITDIKLSGTGMEQVEKLVSNIPGLQFERISSGLFRVQTASQTNPGFYDLWAAGPAGLSQPRSFMVGQASELVETASDDQPSSAMNVALGTTVNGRLEKAGDIDFYRFSVNANKPFRLECVAARIHSPIRPVLELFDSKGRRIATNRGYFGTDPMIEFVPEGDDQYLLKIHELTFSGGPSAIYRLELDQSLRHSLASPGVVPEGKKAGVNFFSGSVSVKADLSSSSRSDNDNGKRRAFTVTESDSRSTDITGLLLPASSAMVHGFSYHHPGSSRPILLQSTINPVFADNHSNDSAAAAAMISAPCDISGFLSAGKPDWFAFMAHKGEVFHLEGFSQRILSQADLQISVFDEKTEKPLAVFNDEFDIPGTAIPTGHLDPVGRWVAPAEGRFFLMAHDLASSPTDTRIKPYQLRVRREEPDYVVIANSLLQSGRLNLKQNGRTPLELIAIRRGGFEGPIQVKSKNLPSGIEMPEMWIAAGQSRALSTVSSENSSDHGLFNLELETIAREVVKKQAKWVAATPSITPKPSSRLISQLPGMVAGKASIRLNATASEPFVHQLYGTLVPRHSPGNIVDVAIQIDSGDIPVTGPVKIRALGLPEFIAEPSAVFAAGENRGYLSFYLPPSMPLGPLSFIIEANVTFKPEGSKSEAAEVIYSNTVNIIIEPAAFLVMANSFAPRQAKRGETIQIAYQSIRRNGFIGKMHTELAMPGKVTDVTGVRGRGETFVGQTDQGSLQIVINDDAPLGKVPFLRILTIGVIEDQAIYQGACFLDLEIVK